MSSSDPNNVNIVTLIQTSGIIADGKIQLLDTCVITKFVKRFRIQCCNMFEDAYYALHLDDNVFINIINDFNINNTQYDELNNVNVTISSKYLAVTKNSVKLGFSLNKRKVFRYGIDPYITIYDNSNVNFINIIHELRGIAVNIFKNIIEENNQHMQQVQQMQQAQQIQQAQQRQNNDSSDGCFTKMFKLLRGKRKQNTIHVQLPVQKPKECYEESHYDNKFHDQLLCVYCLCNQKNIYFLSCGHVCMCNKCSEGQNVCPMCKVPITEMLPAFIS